MGSAKNVGRRPAKNLGNRIAFIILAIFILLWLPVEEHSLVLVLLISGCACILGLLAAISWQEQRRAAAAEEQVGAKKKGLWYLLAGMLAGAGVTLAAITLMAVKTGVHGHGAPDYTPAQVSLVLRLTPLWICLGLIVGGLATAWRR